MVAAKSAHCRHSRADGERKTPLRPTRQIWFDDGGIGKKNEIMPAA